MAYCRRQQRLAFAPFSGVSRRGWLAGAIAAIALLLASSRPAAAKALFIPESQLRGIAPADLDRFQPVKDTKKPDTLWFACFNGKQRVPFSALNDDYCDCLDGSDEPGTSACPNGRFYCRNRGHIPARLPSSRVNDGVCDPECCDGSDEYLGIVTCPDRCDALAEKVREEMRKALRARMEGAHARFENSERGRQLRADKARELEEAKAKIPALEKEVAELLAAKDAAEAVQRAALEEAAKSSSEAAAASNTADAQTAATPAPASQDAQPVGSASQEAIVNGQRVRYDDDDDDGMPEYPFEVADEDGVPVAKIVPAGDELPAEPPVVPSVPVPAPVSIPPPPPPPPELSETVAWRDRNNVLIDERRKVEGLEAWLGKDYGPGDEWAAVMQDGCVEGEVGEYVYTLCLLDSVGQRSKTHGSSVTLGKWGSWRHGEGEDDKYIGMEYTAGDRCWNGPERSVEVTLVCHHSNAILGVTEPAKCEYRMQLGSPNACRPVEEHELVAAGGVKVEGKGATSEKVKDEL